MRAHEITEVYIPTAMDAALRKKGYKILGGGVDQQAYLEPGTGQVLKIFGSREIRGRDYGHEMFFFWTEYCKKHASNPFLPKFSGWKKFEFEGDIYLQIRMERLGKFPYRWDSVLEHLADLVEEGDDLSADEVVDMLVYPETNWGINPELRESLTMMVSHLGEDGFRQLYATIQDLNMIADRQGWEVDLHGGNFMIRNDGTPVIVDPWVV